MAEIDYKQLWLQTKTYLSNKLDYSKLTVAEKLSILLSRIVIVAVIMLFSVCILLHLSGALVDALTKTFDSSVYAYLIVAAIFLVVLLFVIIFKNQLIINPVTRFVTKLFIKPDEEEPAK